MGQTLDVDRLRNLARRGAFAEHLALNGMQGHSGLADFQTCEHPDCVLVRAEVERLRAAQGEKEPEEYPRLKGRCPACHNDTLFRGSKGYITCSWLKCPNPGAVPDMLDAAYKAVTAPQEPLITRLERAHSFACDIASNNMEPEKAGEIGATLRAAKAALINHSAPAPQGERLRAAHVHAQQGEQEVGQNASDQVSSVAETIREPRASSTTSVALVDLVDDVTVPAPQGEQEPLECQAADCANGFNDDNAGLCPRCKGTGIEPASAPLPAPTELMHAITMACGVGDRTEEQRRASWLEVAEITQRLADDRRR